MESCLTTRFARSLDERTPYDVLLSTQNEADFGRRGIAYVHYPWAYMPRPDNEVLWYHKASRHTEGLPVSMSAHLARQR